MSTSSPTPQHQSHSHSPKRRKHNSTPPPLDVLADLPVCAPNSFSQVDRAVPPSDAFPLYLPSPADMVPARPIPLERRRTLIRALLARPSPSSIAHNHHLQQHTSSQKRPHSAIASASTDAGSPDAHPAQRRAVHPRPALPIPATTPIIPLGAPVSRNNTAHQPTTTTTNTAGLNQDDSNEYSNNHQQPGASTSTHPSSNTLAHPPPPAIVQSAPLADPKARPRWTSLDRERKQACLRVALTAACRVAPAAGPLHRLREGWARNPRLRQLVDLRVRRLLADSAAQWTLIELREYLTRAGVGRVSAATRLELQHAVVAHLAPEVAAARNNRS